MENLHLGRTPIREALQRLASEGLLLSAPRRGMFVADIGITDLQKIFEMRMVLEGFCARLAAERATPHQLAQMRAVIAELEQIPNGDNRALMDIDERFHELIYQAADNEFLADTLAHLHALSHRIWHLTLDRIGDVRGAMEQHAAITAALLDCDGARAETLLQRHVADFQREIKAVL